MRKSRCTEEYRDKCKSFWTLQSRIVDVLMEKLIVLVRHVKITNATRRPSYMTT
jgi:hypothetical protein